MTRRPRVPAAIGLLISAACALATTGASALGLGVASLDSGLGEPLRLSLPVTAQADEEIGCVQVRARGNDLPAVFNTRSSVVRVGGQTRIEVTSAQPVNEPAIGIVVSVGCTSPVAREFALILDPPIAPSLPVVAAAGPRSVVEPLRPRVRARASARRPVTASMAPTEPAPRRAPSRRPRASSAPSATGAVATAPRATPLAPPSSVVAPTGTRDRLSVTPTEPPKRGAPSAPAGTTPAGTTPAPSGTTAAPVGATPIAPPVVSPPTVAAPAVVAPPAAVPPSSTAPAAVPATVVDADAASREQALQRQQAALQAQLKALSDQIALLRVQTTSLAARNETLEASALSPWLLWLLVALAVVALAVAAWMATRYSRLRRSLEGSPWWSGNTIQAPTADALDAAELSDGLAPLEGGTKMAAHPAATRTDMRASQARTPGGTVSNVERPRPAVRSQAYPPAIETDFTVSDIEAAMATVRTVSPPRKPATELSDSDFAPLGGQTLPSPFTEPPPPAPRAAPKVDEPAKFVALDIPPTPRPTSGPPPRPLTVTDLRPTEVDAPTSLNFKLDIPSDFDPLASDSHKSTIFSRTDPGASSDNVDFELSAAPTALDFELPSTTNITALTASGHDRPSHGSTALDNLFASDTGRLGPDTILDLDERNGEPLSTTEVDRLTDFGRAPQSLPATEQGRLTHFAELMNQVDEVAPTDALRAIAHLRQYVLREENIPTLLWLRLFELYKAVDKKMVYEALAEHFARRYHRPMIGWTQQLSDRVPQTPLSALRDLDHEIEAAWGTEAGLQRLHSLLCDRDQPDQVVFNAVLQRDLLDAGKIFLLDRDSSISRGAP